MLVRTQAKSTAQAHSPGGVALGKNCRDAAAAAAFCFGQGTRDFLPDDDTTERRRHNRFDDGVREKRRESSTELFRIARILQRQRALHVRPAVQSAGQLEMSVADSP